MGPENANACVDQEKTGCLPAREGETTIRLAANFQRGIRCVRKL